MPVLLPVAAFMMLFLCLASPETGSWRLAWLKSLIIWYTFLSACTEALSWFHVLTLEGVIAAWLAAIGAVSWFGLRHGRFAAGIRAIRDGWAARKRDLLDLPRLAIVAGFIAILAVIAFLSPPNTNDSLTYHMSRVMHWVQDQSVAFYPTFDFRQLWNPPGVEYALLHAQILAGSDRFAPFIQWTSFIGCLVGVSLIADLLGAGVGGQWLSVFFCLTIPMAILQATSTQNDLTTALWAVISIVWALQAMRRRLSLGEWALFGLAIGLGVLAKGTFYVYVIPFLVWLAIAVFKRDGWRMPLLYGSVGIALVLLLNLSQWSRNLATFRDPLGDPASVRMLTNEALTPGAILSNITRDLGMQLITPFEPVNRAIVDGIRWLHGLTRQDLNDPLTSLRPFSTQFTITSEDYGINPVHAWLLLLLWFASVFVLIAPKMKPGLNDPAWSAVILYSAMTFASLVLFAVFYKWQPWGGRLLLPLFVTAAPLFGALLEKIEIPWSRAIVSGILLIGSFPPLFFNTARPVLIAPGKGTSVLTAPREDLLFVNTPEIKISYVELARWVKVTHCTRLGLVIIPGQVEYPLWSLLSPSGKEVRIEHLDPLNPLRKQATLMGVGTANFSPCAVFVTYGKFNPHLLPGYFLAERRDDRQLYVLDELKPLIH